MEIDTDNEGDTKILCEFGCKCKSSLPNSLKKEEALELCVSYDRFEGKLIRKHKCCESVKKVGIVFCVA